jgi:nitrite reductase/ring-hydroxylating ferredoxin subunit
MFMSPNIDQSTFRKWAANKAPLPFQAPENPRLSHGPIFRTQRGAERTNEATVRPETGGIDMAFHAVCKSDEIPIGSLRACSAGGENILVFHLEDGFYATQSSCTHIFAPLNRGKLVEGCQIQCPFHRARFDVRTGEVIQWANFLPGVQLMNFVRGEKALRTFTTKVEDGQVFVDA